MSTAQSSNMEKGHSRTIIWAKQGTQAPVYLAGTFSDWEPMPMTEIGQGTFYAHLIDIAPGVHYYKFRFGEGDWWAIDTDKPTETDAAGNVNNVLGVEPQFDGADQVGSTDQLPPTTEDNQDASDEHQDAPDDQHDAQGDHSPSGADTPLETPVFPYEAHVSPPASIVVQEYPLDADQDETAVLSPSVSGTSYDQEPDLKDPSLERVDTSPEGLQRFAMKLHSRASFRRSSSGLSLGRSSSHVTLPVAEIDEDDEGEYDEGVEIQSPAMKRAVAEDYHEYLAGKHELSGSRDGAHDLPTPPMTPKKGLTDSALSAPAVRTPESEDSSDEKGASPVARAPDTPKKTFPFPIMKRIFGGSNK